MHGHMNVKKKDVKLVRAIYIQGDSGGMVNNFGGGPCAKKVHMNMCPSLNGYRDKSCLNIQT